MQVSVNAEKLSSLMPKILDFSPFVITAVIFKTIFQNMAVVCFVFIFIITDYIYACLISVNTVSFGILFTKKTLNYI